MNIVKVEWVDSSGSESGWRWLSHTKHAVKHCVSVGHLYAETPQSITLVPHIAGEGDEKESWGDLTIPRSAITRIDRMLSQYDEEPVVRPWGDLLSQADEEHAAGLRAKETEEPLPPKDVYWLHSVAKHFAHVIRCISPTGEAQASALFYVEQAEAIVRDAIMGRQSMSPSEEDGKADLHPVYRIKWTDVHGPRCTIGWLMQEDAESLTLVSDKQASRQCEGVRIPKAHTLSSTILVEKGPILP